MNEGNTNAEKWSLEDATKLFDDAIDLTNGTNSDYDFIGEVAKKLGTYRDVFTYLKKTYPELKTKHKTILSNLESNCFSHGKKGDIIPAMAIMNLKANYKWSDRIETKLKGGVSVKGIEPIEWVKDAKDKQ